MQNITLKPITLIADKPLKQVPQQDYSQLFSSIRNSTPYCFADINSQHLTISGLTPRITESSLRQICEEYGKVLDVRLRAFYHNFKATIVAHIIYETPQEAKFAYQELQLKTEAGFSFQICYGAGPQEEQEIKIKPPNNSIRAIIDKLAKLVVQEGSYFELAVKQREQNNSDFAFLFIKSEEQEYYRWKVYTLLNGDSEKHWKTDPYQISLNGRAYHPPEVDQEETQSNYAKRELERQQVQVLKEKRAQNNPPTLSHEDRLKFSNMLRELNTQRQSIGKAMVFCFDNQQCCADISLILMDSMLQESAWNHKLARLYLISDVLHNSGSHGFAYKQYFQWYLADVFSNLKELLPYKEKVMKVLGVWREWNVYESKFLKGLEMTFLEPPQMVDCAAAKLYQEKLLRADDSTIQRISRSRGLPQGERLSMIFRIVQLKFYNRKIVDITQDQVLFEKDSQLNKYLNIYRHIVDKDQQSIIDSQKQSFITQIQLMQEFQKFLQKRYKNIINDADGEQMDWIDEKLFDIQKHNEYQRVEKNYYQNIDGKELTDEDMKLIEDKKVQVILNYDISYIYPKPPPPSLPTEQVEIELQKYREKLQSSGIHSPMRIEEFIKAKRNLIFRVEFMRKEKERLAQQQLILQQQQQQQQQSQQSQQSQQQQQQQQSQSQGKSKKQKKDSSSSDSDHKRKKSKHYRKRSRSDSRKKHSYVFHKIYKVEKKQMNYQRLIIIILMNNKLIKLLFSTINEVDRSKFNKVNDWWKVGGSMSALYSYNYLRVKFIHETLKRKQGPNSLLNLTALDVGVGGGILSESMRRLGASVTGIDVSENSIKTAVEHKNQDPELKNDEKLKYLLISAENLEGQFDIITAMEVIEHVSAPDLFMQSLKRLLAPNGILFLSTINRSYESYIKLIIGAEYITGIVPIGTHDWNQFKTPEEIWFLLNKNKMKQIELRGVEYNLLSGEMNYSDNQTQYIISCQYE